MNSSKEIEMVVAGLVLDQASNAPIVILKDPTGDTCLPIWIGLAEATAIASALKRVQLVRPMTHDLLKNVIDELGANVIRIVVHGLEDNTFIANIEIQSGDVLRTIDSRPSDAIALAVRVGCSIFVSEEVLAQAQVTMVSTPPQAGEGGEIPPEEGPVEESPAKNFAIIEKEKWAEILAEMDPDDFKYKM